MDTWVKILAVVVVLVVLGIGFWKQISFVYDKIKMVLSKDEEKPIQEETVKDTQNDINDPGNS